VQYSIGRKKSGPVAEVKAVGIMWTDKDIYRRGVVWEFIL